MAHVAFFTFGILIEPPGHEKVQGFMDLVPSVFDTVAVADGFIDRAIVDNWDEGKTLFEQDRGAWGPFAIPRFYTGSLELEELTAVQTLSLWRDLPAVRNFSYRGKYHAQALRQRNEWVVHPQWPSYVAWWIDEGEFPTWEEACKRHEHLHDKGSTAFAFDFKSSFDADGQPITFSKKPENT